MNIPFHLLTAQSSGISPEPGSVPKRKRPRHHWTALLSLPFILIAAFISYEVFGMCANHISTSKQTRSLQMDLQKEIPDIKIISVYSETGNTSGTGNHVDRLSSIIFSSEMPETEIEDRMSKYYALDGWSCYLRRTDDGHHMIYLNTPAPFPDNIEGH